MKEEPKKFEKKSLKDSKKEASEFMKEEYKKSGHYKRKVADRNLNKIMGRIRLKAKGPNPLSIRRKIVTQPKEINNIADKEGNKDEEMLKKKRKRKRKNKEKETTNE